MATPEPIIVGWLLVLCLVLTIFLPASTLYGLVANTVPALLRSHTVKNTILFGVRAFLFGGVAVFSVVAGLRLWMVKPGAVRLAKRFLLTFLLAHLGYFVFWFLLFKPVSSSRLAVVAWNHVAAPLLPFFLWTVYLEHSKRVRATYPETRLGLPSAG
jgi:hypothetical protein